ncbi:MAG: 1-acyl-sn-glycerol-3-phosphate acyltransferase [Prolixibacteraceae bacterium]|nr:1-acyl-sn-glycerol-3-phosphate acyltransferase [Prolixibacteraceae bacterium]
MKYEKWSLGYYLLKKYVQFADWFIHKRIIITGEENIPQDKPIVFAPNHQNALSDPMAILLNTKFQPVWLARADIFKNKTAAKILRFMKILPVYRMRDGKENLVKNDDTFMHSVKVLENNSALGLFPEAAHTGRRQMIQHKKAVPRIVFMAEENTNEKLDIQIIPSGIYYSSYWKFNRTLIVNFGKPIAVREFMDEYRKNSNAATLQLRDRIYDSILPLVMQISSEKHYDDFETIREIYGRYYLLRKNQKYSILNLFKSDQEMMVRLDKLEVQRPQEIENLVQMVNSYASNLKKVKIKNWLIERHYYNTIKAFISLIILFASLPLFLYGFIFNAIPFLAIDNIVRKKVKDVAFWSTFFQVLGLVVFPVFYIIELLVLWNFIPSVWLKIAFVVSLPLMGKIAFQWYILLLKTMGRFRLLFLKIFKRKVYYSLFKQKDLLLFKLDELISV